MKKFLCVAASLLMAASLTACGSKDEGKKDDGKHLNPRPMLS